MLHRLYGWTMGLAAHPNALWALALVAFAESSFFPVPVEVILIPMVLAARDRAWTIALVATAASVLGGVAGYGIGAFLFQAVGRPMLEFYGMMDRFAEFQARYNEWGAWIVFGAGVTPFPYKVITIASGVTGLDPSTFMVASVASRGGKFFVEAGLLYWFGQPIRTFLERRLGLVAAVGFCLLVGGFLLIRFVS